MNRRAGELLKTLLICLLSANLLALAALTWVYDESLLETPAFSWTGPIRDWLGLRAAQPQPIAPVFELAPEAAARPIRAVVTQGGAHQGVQYDTAAVDALYERLKLYLGEAMGSADVPRVQTEAQWRAALAGDGIYWEYRHALPLSLLADWLAVEAPDAPDARVRRLLLSDADGALQLLFADEQSGRYYLCETVLRYTPVEAANLLPCRFAWEEDALPRAPDTVLFDSPPEPTKAAVETPSLSGPAVESFLRALHINPDTPNRYLEKDGTEVFMDGDRVCRLSPDGTIRYRASETADGNGVPSLTASVEIARALLGTLSPLFGDARLILTGFSLDGGRYTVYFGYELEGAEVRLADEGPAARVVVADGDIVMATVLAHRITLSSERVSLMPESWACLLFQRRTQGPFTLTVCYEETEGVLEPAWFGF